MLQCQRDLGNVDSSMLLREWSNLVEVCEQFSSTDVV